VENPKDFSKKIDKELSENDMIRKLLDDICRKFCKKIKTDSIVELYDDNLYKYGEKEDFNVGKNDLEPFINFEAILKICPIELRRRNEN